MTREVENIQWWQNLEYNRKLNFLKERGLFLRYKNIIPDYGKPHGSWSEQARAQPILDVVWYKEVENAHSDKAICLHSIR